MPRRKIRPTTRGNPAESAVQEASQDAAVAREVVFVQGGGEGTHDSWDDKLVASLEAALGSACTIRYPRMPDEANPDPAVWKRVITSELDTSTSRVMLVGHSVGAAVVLDCVADGKVKPERLAGVFLIATPFLGDGGWPSGDLRPTKEAAEGLPPHTPLFLYQGDDDETVPVAHLDMLKTVLPHAVIRRLEGRDHQLNDDLSEVARDIQLVT